MSGSGCFASWRLRVYAILLLMMIQVVLTLDGYRSSIYYSVRRFYSFFFSVTLSANIFDVVVFVAVAIVLEYTHTHILQPSVNQIENRLLLCTLNVRNG